MGDILKSKLRKMGPVPGWTIALFIKTTHLTGTLAPPGELFVALKGHIPIAYNCLNNDPDAAIQASNGCVYFKVKKRQQERFYKKTSDKGGKKCG